MRVASFLLAVLATGCRGADDLRAVRAERAPRRAAASPSTGIDPHDTYVRAEVYEDRSHDVPFDVPVFDPVTGRMTTVLHLDSPADHLLIEAGYDASGVPRFAITDLNPRDNARQTIGGPNDLTVYGPDGRPLVPDARSGAGAGNPLTSIGLDATTDVLSGFVLGRTPWSPTDQITTSDTLVRIRTRSADGTTVVRSFQRGPDGVARLREVETTVLVRGGARPARSVDRLRVVRLTINVNAARDARRRARTGRRCASSQLVRPLWLPFCSSRWLMGE